MLRFLGIGAQKAGTTWLYSVLSRHPDVSFPAGKEVHFWDQRYDKGIDWYRNLVDTSTSSVEGEITPAYAILAPERIRQCHIHFPRIRLIYLIRNPMERAWSSALMALKRAEMTTSEASDQWFVDHFNSAGSRARGDYAGCIASWRRVYPENQLLIGTYDVLRDDPRRLVADVCAHLGIPDDPLTSLDDAFLRRNVAPVPGVEKAPIRPSLLPHLREIYAPRIEALSILLGSSFSHWQL
jgi:hypothetical protein